MEISMYLENYKKWLSSPYVDEATKAELKNLTDDEDIEYRFIKMLDFGTAGLRGIMGAGLNMMNVYTVRYTTQGLADLISACGEDAKKRGVAIAFDSRNNSTLFSKEVACVLAANGIKAYIFDELRPTPELSFALREKGCIAGVNVTASHNPKQYNGYKVYWEDGAQLPPDHAKQISDRLSEIDIFEDVKVTDFDKAKDSGLIEIMGSEMDERYLEEVLKQSLCSSVVKEFADTFKIIYTPFHGAGYRLVPEMLRRIGFKHIVTVDEQMVIDGNFPTVKSPNPEDKDGFTRAIEMAKEQDIDLIIGTDPDADRVGIVVRSNTGDYVTLSGNQVAVLLLDFVIRCRKQNGTLPKNAAAVKSIVSTSMASAVCKKHGVKMFDVLTGFKFIGEKIKEFEASGDYTYIFGFEESYGYLSGTYARDKDAVNGSMLIAEMACWYHKQGMSLYDAMQELYKTYGYYREDTVSVTMSGLDGLERIKSIGVSLRANVPTSVAGLKVLKVRDYQSGVITDNVSGAAFPTGLPSSDVLFFELENDCILVIRPSGTEPKIKFYVIAKADSADACAAVTEAIKADAEKLISI